MASTSQNKLLRVGVIQDGRIVEEHHVRRDTVTIGNDARNTIVLPASDDRESRFALLENQNQQYQLVIDEKMQGRVNLGSSDVDFTALRENGLATRRGDLYVLPLQESARGKVELGDATLFFQFVTPPPEDAKPVLPPDVKGGVWKTLDRVFFGILAASLLIHFTGAAIIMATPAPVERELELDQLEDRFVRAIIPQAPPKQEKPADTGAAEAKADKPKDEPKKDTPQEKPAGGAPASDAGERRKQVEQKVANKGLLKLLGGKGREGDSNAIENVMGGSSGSTGDIAKALEGASGVGVATKDAIGTTGPRGGDAGKVEGIGALGTSGGRDRDLGTKEDTKVVAVVKDATPEVDSSDVDPNAVNRYIKGRIASIRNCYEKELKRNPNLKGKVLMRFNIKPSGRTGDVEVEENTMGNDAVGSCITSVIRGWTFPFKPDSDVAVAYPFVFQSGG